MDKSEVLSLPRSDRNKLMAAFVCLFFFIVVDLSIEFETHIFWDFVIEGCILASASILGLTLLNLYRREKEVSLSLQKDLSTMKADLTTWQKKTEKIAKDFQDHIEIQLIHWGLSASEKEVCLLILKGMSSKQIAELRTTSERTIRNQSSSIYKKSKLKGKGELMTFFLEDLLG